MAEYKILMYIKKLVLFHLIVYTFLSLTAADASLIEYQPPPDTLKTGYKQMPFPIEDLLYDFHPIAMMDIYIQPAFLKIAYEPTVENNIFNYYIELMEGDRISLKKVVTPFWKDMPIQKTLDSEDILRFDVNIEERIEPFTERASLEAVFLIALTIFLLGIIVFRMIPVTVGVALIIIWLFIWKHVVAFIIPILPSKLLTFIEFVLSKV